MKKQELEKVIDQIFRMDNWELSDVIDVVRVRSGQLQPNRELLMLAVP